ncbi:hypothetical protein [Streptomyces capitiformicae]|uniref:Uncharacterized protein n=1 Tax=Streptomyces capitiformicae TaxID=2014920 RepID=A0A918ZN74_9ACTN|nr:hypothetical protein [Streptomyces capitiformicae]GHE61230.1 hypothetical protein GCM10017771_84370 [Streptomyces capitiformicae]
MQWTALLATALGAAIGIVSTSIADRARWRRDTSERDREALRTSFSPYVEALKEAYDAITHVSTEVDRPIDERAEVMRMVIGQHGVYAKQHQLELMAPLAVTQLALAAAHKLARGHPRYTSMHLGKAGLPGGTVRAHGCHAGLP